MRGYEGEKFGKVVKNFKDIKAVLYSLNNI